VILLSAVGGEVVPANKSEISGRFTVRGWGTFAPEPDRRFARHNFAQKPRVSPQLRRVWRVSSYAAARRTGCPTMIRKQEKPMLTLPAMSSSEYEAAVAAFIRIRGVTRCPTACVVRTQASVSAADRAALEQYEAQRELSRRTNFAAAAALFGAPLPTSGGDRPH
jgi:hypothetical protein